MKKLIIFSILATLAMITVCTYTQAQTQPDSTVVVTQPETPVQDAQSTASMVMTALAIIGALVRIVIQTVKGVKNPDNNTPITFDFGYWIKDNLLPKVTVILTFILTLSAPFKLPDSTLGIVILGAIAFGVGYFIDYLTDIFGGIAKKQAVKFNAPKKS